MQAASSRRVGLAATLALVLIVGLLGGCGSENAGYSGDARPRSGVAAGPTLPAPTATPRTQPPTQGDDRLPTVTLAQLPPEARQTIQLIDRGGPFPYDKDGSTFGNRERLLPEQPQGYYREYTVVTPGSPDRGARRIVAGQGGELYYTDDHYDSFKRIVR